MPVIASRAHNDFPYNLFNFHSIIQLIVREPFVRREVLDNVKYHHLLGLFEREINYHGVNISKCWPMVQ